MMMIGEVETRNKIYSCDLVPALAQSAAPAKPAEQRGLVIETRMVTMVTILMLGTLLMTLMIVT